jgi:hypothetical protein
VIHVQPELTHQLEHQVVLLVQVDTIVQPEVHHLHEVAVQPDIHVQQIQRPNVQPERIQ